MDRCAEWYVKTDEGKIYGPASEDKLVRWADEGRIDPSCFVSQDRISWRPAQMFSPLGMKWLVETEPGTVFGPFSRAVVIRLFKSGEVPESARTYCLYEFAIDQDPPPVEKAVVEVIDPVVDMPPPKSPGSLFDNVGRAKLAALEAAAQRELVAAKRFGGRPFGIFGGKKK